MVFKFLSTALLAASVFLFMVTPAFAQGAKRVEVDLTKQRLYAYEGGTLVYNFLISSGKWYRTPTGEFKPWIKLRSTRMAGGSRALGTYYNLPNVPYVVYFYQGYGIHGTYWHNNFGRPMSHGCVNVSIPNMALLYNWIELSTPIRIYGAAPV